MLEYLTFLQSTGAFLCRSYSFFSVSLEQHEDPLWLFLTSGHIICIIQYFNTQIGTLQKPWTSKSVNMCTQFHNFSPFNPNTIHEFTTFRRSIRTQFTSLQLFAVQSQHNSRVYNFSNTTTKQNFTRHPNSIILVEQYIPHSAFTTYSPLQAEYRVLLVL